MQVFFSQVPQQYAGDSDYFVDAYGKQFYYMLEINPECFTIYDTAGRIMPFDRTDGKELGTALFAVTSVYNAEDKAAKVFSDEMNKLTQLLEHFQDNPQ